MPAPALYSTSLSDQSRPNPKRFHSVQKKKHTQLKWTKRRWQLYDPLEMQRSTEYITSARPVEET